VGVQVKLWDPWEHVSYLSASAVVIHYEEALYQVYAPLPLPLPRPHAFLCMWFFAILFSRLYWVLLLFYFYYFYLFISYFFFLLSIFFFFFEMDHWSDTNKWLIDWKVWATASSMYRCIVCGGRILMYRQAAKSYSTAIAQRYERSKTTRVTGSPSR